MEGFMLKLIISGCNGFMGKAVADIAADEPDISIVAGFDITEKQQDIFPVFKHFDDFVGETDVLVDFSTASALDELLEFACKRHIPLVLCATGYTPEQIISIEETSKKIPVFRSGNMSLGINLLADLIRRACAVLGEQFDVEIIEHHHRRKLDAPSGTALMLADAAASALPYSPEYVYDRSARRESRPSHEIGISAVRGGTVVGEHEVIFAGSHEIIKLSHNAASREVFAAGAIKAARFMATIKTPGLYSMSDVLSQV